MTVLRAAPLIIDGTGAAPVRDVSLVFRDGRIEAITPGAAGGSPREDETAASGMTVLPGLIDCHDHTAVAIVSPVGGIGDSVSPSGHECVVPHDPALPPSVANGVDEVRRVVRIMVRAGADVIKCATTGGASSRAGHGHPPNAAELEHLVAAGMSPMQAIQAATGWAAECLGLAHELGTLEKGKRADAVVVEDGRVEVSR